MEFLQIRPGATVGTALSETAVEIIPPIERSHYHSMSKFIVNPPLGMKNPFHASRFPSAFLEI